MTVSNTLSSVIPTLFAQGLDALRHNAVMPRLVNADFGTEVKEKGEVIQVPLPSVMTVSAVVPGAYAPDPQNVAPTTASIPLDSWYESPFTLSEKELAQVVDGIVPIQLSAAVEALAVQINSDILNNYTSVYGYVGTAGTTPFASSLAVATTAREILGIQLAPTANRRMVLSPAAEANALALPAFSQYLQSGDKGVITEGDIGRKLGFDWYMDQQVPTHTSGTITTGLTAESATVQAVGLTAIVATTAASTGACALLKGDIITFSGDTQTYVLTANATQATAATNVTLNISPGKAVALAGGETITVAASHVVNLAFARDAFAFASRPVKPMNLGRDIDEEFYVADPVSKITMRLSYRQEFHRTRFAFDCLYGTAVLRSQLATRLAG
jgi:P22 coat protein - gene protein 5